MKRTIIFGGESISCITQFTDANFCVLINLRDNLHNQHLTLNPIFNFSVQTRVCDLTPHINKICHQQVGPDKEFRLNCSK